MCATVLSSVKQNCLSVQYGGSEAHSTFFQRQRGDWEAATQSRDFLTSIRRFYSNAYTDAEKQDAINLFLGNFVPQHGHAALWELDSDYFLHAGTATYQYCVSVSSSVTYLQRYMQMQLCLMSTAVFTVLGILYLPVVVKDLFGSGQHICKVQCS